MGSIKKYEKHSGRSHCLKWDSNLKEKYMVHDGFDLRLMELCFNVICCVTGEISRDNAHLTVEILRNYEDK